MNPIGGGWSFSFCPCAEFIDLFGTVIELPKFDTIFLELTTI